MTNKLEKLTLLTDELIKVNLSKSAKVIRNAEDDKKFLSNIYLEEIQKSSIQILKLAVSANTAPQDELKKYKNKILNNCLIIQHLIRNLRQEKYIDFSQEEKWQKFIYNIQTEIMNS